MRNFFAWSRGWGGDGGVMREKRELYHLENYHMSMSVDLVYFWM